MIRQVMSQHFPEGAEKRFLGYKKPKVSRQALYALGPFHEIAGDGHEKLGALALQMGGIGLPIYGYRDKWSGKLLKINVVPDCRSAGAVGHLYLDLIEEIGGHFIFKTIIFCFLAHALNSTRYSPSTEPG